MGKYELSGKKNYELFPAVYQITRETAKEYTNVFINWFDECLKINILHFYYLKIRGFMREKSDLFVRPSVNTTVSREGFGHSPGEAAEIAKQARIKQERDAAVLKKRIDAQKRAAAILALKSSKQG
ncbi:MAG: hypothetical protein WC774_00135 [Candidatus Gracilibacteria bacterium]